MAKLLIVNGSPRAPKSNSKQYAKIFEEYWYEPVDTYAVLSGEHEKICNTITNYEHILFVFPLYADALPTVLMGFLKQLEQVSLPPQTKIHTLINCGFLEPKQNDVAIAILRYFCKRNNFSYGMTLRIASGEAILTTPFSFLVRNGIKKFASQIRSGKCNVLSVTMPLTKKMFLRASTQYWKQYGETFHTTEEQMRSLKIEGN